MSTQINIQNNIAAIQARIEAACQLYQRQSPPILMAVTKTRNAAEISEAIAAGLTHLGENYLQEALDKQRQLTSPELQWHFIGPIQTNKTRAIASHFDWVHSVDRAKIITRLNDQRPAELPPLNVCLQINLNDESSKAGIPATDVIELAALALKQPRLILRGLMAIPVQTSNAQEQRQNFAALENILTDLKNAFPQASLDTLSMGMSGDMESAIAEGATIVRIGSDIFGPRPTAKP
ncbi:Pyridoxal phosphate homeostasis protein [Zhongshania aliphaticivorans]|uniref:Pyridoxal phosphate homeostasis protein n=1 Tax=Zhongshania aliphaticivorans TaxID=1470434 RepID=A0A5S9PQ39_9GAMM|nr:YggS family pyridoxal phosphate-dependent enzyme [Zhongshania aliphaticivorans]CAA0106149.1 Pyridoxal phosphate homeostasis protein [Zhongshania aliphaticivorans]CAA0106363.1 Pyridoxal phosphate homeostasis protein [Zhongshania aliphaticivorans]